MSPHRTQLSLTQLIKAQKNFEIFRKRLDDDQLKAGATQAFEYCLELALWFDFLDARNATPHTYEEDVIENIISLFPLFSVELEQCIKTIKSKLDESPNSHGRTPL